MTRWVITTPSSSFRVDAAAATIPGPPGPLPILARTRPLASWTHPMLYHNPVIMDIVASARVPLDATSDQFVSTLGRGGPSNGGRNRDVDHCNIGSPCQWCCQLLPRNDRQGMEDNAEPERSGLHALWREPPWELDQVASLRWKSWFLEVETEAFEVQIGRQRVDGGRSSMP